MTTDTLSAKIYTDDTLRNEWSHVDTNGNSTNGFFEHASDYKYICPGGNQAWNWGDVDPAFKYDDVTIYSGVLDSTQIASIMAAKKAHRIQYLQYQRVPVIPLQVEKFGQHPVLMQIRYQNLQGEIVLSS